MLHRSRSALGTIGLLAAALAVGACQDSTTPELDDAFLMDVALLAADATLEDVTLWAQPFGFGSASVSSSEDGTYAHGLPGGHGGWFGTFSGTRSVTFFDEEGNEQAAYDPLRTASIHILHEIMGEVTRDGWSASVHRMRDKTVSGLAGEETHRTWNGTGSEEISRSRHLDDGAEHSYSSTGTVEYESVVVPIPGSDPPWPISGTIRRTMTVVRSGPDGEVTRTFAIEITFDGTAIATAVINGEVVEIDLSTRTGDNPVRRHRR
jgi:hypothetical protein